MPKYFIPSAWRHLLPSGTVLLVPVFCIGLVALMWAGLAYQTAYERNAQIEHREEEHDNLARLFEEHVLGVLASASIVLKEVESEYRRQGARLDLARYLRERPELRSYHYITVIDRDGYMVLNSGPFQKPLSVRETENFQYHLNNTNLDLYVAQPGFGIASGEWTIHVTRRMNRPDGAFGGSVAVGVDPAYFSRFYDQISLGRDSVVVLAGRDGIVRARRSNENAEVGQDMKQSPLFTSDLPAREAGQGIWSTRVDGFTRIYSYRSVTGFPLVVLVGSSRDVVLESVERRARVHTWWAAGISILIFAFAALTTLQGIRRQRYEQALRKRDAALQEAQAMAHLGSWTWHIREDRVECSAEMHRIFGIPKEGCAGKLVDAMWRAIHPDDRAAVEQANLAVIRDKKPVSIEYRVLRSDATMRVVWAEASEIILDEAGNPAVLTGIVQDITERKRAEISLRESEEKFRVLANSISAAIFLYQGEKMRYCNPACLELAGYSLEEMLAMRFWDMIHPDFQVLVKQRGFSRQSGETVASRYEVKIVRKNGEERWVEFGGGLVTFEGNPAVVGVAFDISERKRAEEALRESETRYRALAETAADAIITADADGRIVGWNLAAERMFGHVQEQIMGQPLTVIMPERYRDAHVRGLRATGARDVAGATGQPMQLHGLTRDRREIPVELSLSRWSIARGTFYTAVVRDISERKRLEEAHLQSQKLESLGTLAGGIAHDFNNILTAIRGNVDLAAEDVGPDHIAAESLAEIRKASARAGELVRRIMAFGRPKPAQHKAVDLSAVADEVLKLLRSTLPAGIALTQHFAKDTPHVLADAGQVHEAIVNLTTNAAHAIGPRAGVIDYRLEPVQVREDLARSIPGLRLGAYARLSVCDNGCGMDAATMERVFDAFYTTKPVGEGTGLGLSMVHGIMRSHGGAVTVESTVGKGTSFALYFPVAKERAQKEKQGALAQSVRAAGQRVLYVDDEEALVSLARRVLARLGHSTAGFTDPKEALAVFRAQPQEFDIVVTDLSMPQMSGFELAREVLALRPEIPVLMTTGYLRAEDEGRARLAGIRELVLKPVTVDELGRVFERMLRHS